MASDLLDVVDLDPGEVRDVLTLADRPPSSLGRPLDGQGAALIFEKPSNRTRQSMEIAVVQLGGHPVYTRGEEVGFDTREPVEDIARIMSGYHALIAARVHDHRVAARLAAAADVPVVNMLSDWSHPLQAFADALTMQHHLGDLAGKTVAYVGDYNNVSRSLAEICLMLEMRVRLGCPVGFEASPAELERLSLIGSVEQSPRPHDAVAGAHAVHTDTWVSMGQEDDKEARRRAVRGVHRSIPGDDVQRRLRTRCSCTVCRPTVASRSPRTSSTALRVVVVTEQGHNRMHSARGRARVFARSVAREHQGPAPAS